MYSVCSPPQLAAQKKVEVWPRRGSRNATMAKSKNHTAHNQTYKQHKNGIKKPRKFRESSKKGVRLTADCTRVDR